MLAVADVDYRLFEGQLDEASTVEAPVKAPRRPEPSEPASRATSGTADVGAERPAVTASPTLPQVKSHGFRLLQQWEGVVSHVSEDSFTAVLRDLANRKSPDESASFESEQVDPPDRRLIIPGAVFYWWIGYQDSPTGTRWTVSTIRFRRLPAWTPSDMRRIRRDIEVIRGLFAGTD